jgi:hypothetical protein
LGQANFGRFSEEKQRFRAELIPGQAVRELMLEAGDGGCQGHFVFGRDSSQIEKHTIVFDARNYGWVGSAKSLFDLICRQLRVSDRD